MNRILVAFDYFSPTFPLVNNNLNFNSTLDKLRIDNGTYEFFNKIGGYDCVPTLTLNDNDLFIYPIKITLNPNEWPINPDIDILASTSMTLNIFNSICGRNGYLFFDLGAECAITDEIIQTIHKYVYLKKIPLNKVILQTGNTNGKEQYNNYCFRHSIPLDKGMNISCLEYFEWMCSRHIYEYKNSGKDVPLPKNIDFTKIQKTFLCLNRRHRWHRVNLFLLWNIHNLINDSYFTLNKKSGLPSENILKDLFDKKLIEKYNIKDSQLNDIEFTLPLELDEFKDSGKMALLYGPIDSYYQSSLISVVTETNFMNPSIFNTEKIFKPMVHRQPFILVGPYKTLENLRSMGYKTFNDFWDEGYDNIEDPNERLIKIVELCKEINEWDDNKKKILFYKSMSNTTHNYELLSSFYATKKMRSNFWHEFRDKKLFPIK
jgi:hypothetical protein